MSESLREKALALPMKPGVYIMRDISDTVIYVGKAKLLKNRVSSYFHGAHNAKTEAMISKIHDFSVIIANSEFEALVLENSLIKHHAPKYNILLKDDKGYPFIRLDVKSEYPRFTIASRRADDGAMYFGPYGGRSATRSAIDALCKTLRLPTCSKKFPADIGRERPCLNHHMGMCDAYCQPGKSREEYKEAVDKAVLILQGKTDEVISSLKEKMEKAASELRFEEAAGIRDSINAITTFDIKQKVWSKSSSDTDAVGFVRGDVKSCFVVLHYIQGQLLGKDTELINDPIGDETAVSQLVRQYYSGLESAPRSVLLPENVEDAEELEMFLTEMSGHKVTVTVPQRSNNRAFVMAAQMNAQEEIMRSTTAEERVTKTARWLADALKLDKPPQRIESFDISNTGNSEIVASMVVFEQGKPLKRDYRKFKINSTDGADDYGSMREAVGRRFSRFADGDEKFSTVPDLLLIDGGAAHASAAREAMEQAGGNVPVFGMVKDDHHRTRALVTPEGMEIGIAAVPSVFAFIGNIQEETHRFAIEYHRSRRSKAMKASQLDNITGVGEKRKNDLLRHFKSIKAISAAGEEELGKVVPKNTAKAIFEYFHDKSGD